MKKGNCSPAKVTAPRLIPWRGFLLLHARLDLGEILEQGKKLRWKKPRRCPSCRTSGLWGHGFVLRYFFGFVEGLWMKRWRCPECGAVHTARPQEYAPGVQHSMVVQQESLLAKLAGKPFLPELSRQAQQHWKKVFTERCGSQKNWMYPDEQMAVAGKISQTGITKRRIHRESLPDPEPPYLLLRPFYVSLATLAEAGTPRVS